MKFLRIVFYFLILLTGIYFVLGYYVDSRLASKVYPNSYNDCHKVWTARGLYGGGVDQNSIESIRHAFDEGAMGVEVDIRYDLELKDYIVSHDYPYNKKNGKILFLSELFDALGDHHFFWLDFKAIRRLTEEQAIEAAARLTAISQKNDLKNRIYIESSNPTNLSLFKQAGFHSIFDTQPAPSNHFLAPFMITMYKIFFYFGDYSVMGMEYGELKNPIYGSETRKRLGNIPVFLYHLPVDEDLINEILRLKAVRVFIVGNNQSVNFHSKNACSTS